MGRVGEVDLGFPSGGGLGYLILGMSVSPIRWLRTSERHRVLGCPGRGSPTGWQLHVPTP
jgi:hypothetical protein